MSIFNKPLIKQRLNFSYEYGESAGYTIHTKNVIHAVIVS